MNYKFCTCLQPLFNVPDLKFFRLVKLFSLYSRLLLPWKVVSLDLPTYHKANIRTSENSTCHTHATSPNMKHSAVLQIAILALVGMASSMSLLFFSGGDNCWTGVTDVSSDQPPPGQPPPQKKP